MCGIAGFLVVKAARGRDSTIIRSFLPPEYVWPERMPMHPNECRFAAKILKICVHARASVSDSTVRGRDYVSQVNSVSGSLGIYLESFIFCAKIVSLIQLKNLC